MIFNQQKPINPNSNKHKCRIRIKKSADGSVIKEISGNCSDSELKALREGEEQ